MPMQLRNSRAQSLPRAISINRAKQNRPESLPRLGMEMEEREERQFKVGPKESY